MNEELDSQLSAMFDDELPEAECQLLARRLSRDDALKARWRQLCSHRRRRRRRARRAHGRAAGDESRRRA